MNIRTIVAVGAILLSGVMAPAEDKAIAPTEKMPLFNGKDFTGWSFFLRDPQVSPNDVWSVKDGTVHCKGQPPGYMRTEADYANYKLHVEWRWVGDGGNSGVLVHMSLPDKVWPKSIECQLMSKNAGDFFVIGGTDFKEHTNKEQRRVPKKSESSEKPLGEWNVYEITCKDNTIRVCVNGVLQNEATETTVSSGKICLQSEGKPIEFQNICIEPAD